MNRFACVFYRSAATQEVSQGVYGGGEENEKVRAAKKEAQGEEIALHVYDNVGNFIFRSAALSAKCFQEVQIAGNDAVYACFRDILRSWPYCRSPII
jgi:hypothetical protein